MRPWVYPYAQIADHYRALIKARELLPGTQLPAIAEIAEEWSVAIATVQRALRVLRSEGLVRAVHGKGTFVADPPP